MFGRRKIVPCLAIWGLALVIFVIAGCGQLVEPEFKRVENIRLVRPGLNESVLTLDLYYFNPNKSRLKLKSAEGGVWIDNKYLGAFNVDSLVLIPPYSEFRMPIRLRMETGGFIANSFLAILGKPLRIRIEGHAKAGKSGVFIRIPIFYEAEYDIRELVK